MPGADYGGRDGHGKVGQVIFAYADPPYIGQAKKHYKDHPDYAGEVNHRDLINDLQTYFPDGWALSCSSPSLQEILSYSPQGVRIGAWVKPFCAFKKNVDPAYAWEPVIFYKGRKRRERKETERDWCAESITLRKGLSGVKPLGFCYWIFEMLGMTTEDELVDLFPGSGAVMAALELWRKDKTN